MKNAYKELISSMREYPHEWEISYYEDYELLTNVELQVSIIFKYNFHQSYIDLLGMHKIPFCYNLRMRVYKRKIARDWTLVNRKKAMELLKSRLSARGER